MRTFFLAIVLCIPSLRAEAQYNMELLGNLPYVFDLSSLWGYTDTSGNPYALVGTYTGFSIVDIQDPADPQELFFVPGALSAWREVKTWDQHAYVTNENDGGLLIVDLSYLPDTIYTSWYTGADTLNPLRTAHTLWIDENGYCYLFGYNVLFGASEGAYILDLNIDPASPVLVGELTGTYLHDGYVRGDTLWGAAIYEDQLQVYDVSDKSAPALIGVQITEGGATHNCWPDATGNYVFTTDESLIGYVSSFDASDPGDITLLDKIKHGDPDHTIPHNVIYKDGWLVTAHYTEGVCIFDAHKPENLVEVAHYDCSPYGPEAIFAGVWGVYPFFEDGTIIASDIEEGLMIFQPEYVRAAYLEGKITNAATGGNIFNAHIQVMGTEVEEFTNVLGEYKTGYAIPGFYDVEISVAGCVTETVENVLLESGETVTLNLALDCVTAVDDLTNSIGLTAYYNISAQEILCTVNAQAGPVALQLCDVQGRIRYTGTTSSNGNLHIPTGSLPAGIYTVYPAGGEPQQAQKVMVF
ncbi:MAG: choice-of-anchor B family protein [Chitinophagales bacterium]